MAGLSDSGFQIQRLPEIIAVLRNKGTEVFQDLVTPGDSVDVSDSSVIGRQISIISEALADLWEAGQQVYSAFDPNSAQGVALDNLVAYGALIRQERTYSVVQVLITGDNGKTIPQGIVFSSNVDQSQFSLVKDVLLTPAIAAGIVVQPNVIANNTTYTISYSVASTTNTITYTTAASGTSRDSILAGISSVISSSHPTLNSVVSGAGNTGVIRIQRNDEYSTVNFNTSTNLTITKVIKVGEAQATVYGPITADTDTVVNIDTPMLGLDSVTNISPASVGREKETDEELRLRFRNAKFEKSQNIIESLYSALINTAGVERVVVYENDTNVVDGFGLPPHSFMPIVLGGVGSDIAQAIWENKPLGILSYGNTSVTIYDSQGLAHIVSYRRPDPVPIYITINITEDGTFPASGPDDIRTAIINYFNDNLSIGDDVIYSRLYTPINSVPNFQVDSLAIGKSPNPTGTSNLAIGFSEIATVSAINIIVQ